MPAPFAFCEWNYKGKLVRTVVDDDGGVYVVRGDIRRILLSKDSDRTPSGLVDHASPPFVDFPHQETFYDENLIKALLQDSLGPEVTPLAKWLESVVKPALYGAGRNGKGYKTNAPILAGLKAMTELLAARVAALVDEDEEDEEPDEPPPRPAAKARQAAAEACQAAAEARQAATLVEEEDDEPDEPPPRPAAKALKAHIRPLGVVTPDEFDRTPTPAKAREAKVRTSRAGHRGGDKPGA